MASQNDPPDHHIPAWKKLGLKLKYAQEKSDPITTTRSQIVNGKKRKRVSENDTLATDESVKHPKKTKVEALGSTSDASNSDTFQPSPPGGLTSHPTDPKTPSRPGGPRKSVSFTPDTKKTDGDSVKQLYQVWLNSHAAKDPSFDPSAFNPNPAIHEVIEPHKSSSPTLLTQSATTTTPKETKKANKAKNSKPAKPQSNGQGGEEYTSLTQQATLDYLLKYHQSRSSWKFSKSRQSRLLRYLFSPGFIPSSYYLALQAYLLGLQGKSAKSRLRKAARKIQAEDSHNLEGSQDVDEAGAQAHAHGPKEDNTASEEKQNHTEQDLKTGDEETKTKEKKKKKEKDDRPSPNPNPNPTSNETLLSTRKIADLVLQTIGTDADDDEVEVEDNDEDDNHKPPLPNGQSKSKSNLLPLQKTNNEQNKLKLKPNSATSTTPQSRVQAYKTKKRIRKHKARVELPTDDESSSESSSNSESDR